MKIIFFTVLLLLTYSNSYGQNSDIDSLKSWLNYISSDELKGRKNGSKEIGIVQDWMADKFSEYGLIPLEKLNGFNQTFTAKNRNDSIVVRNVIGYSPGIYKDSFIIVSAHIDHIGIRKKVDNDSICNGADDNSSGVTTLLGIAKKMYEQKRKLNYSIVYIAYGGEELGLVGSGYFCKNKTLPFDKVKLNINIEMDGRTLEFGKNKFYITGPSRSNLIDIINQYNKNKQWQIKDIGTKAESFYYMSDNHSFERFVNDSVIQVPAHTFCTSTGVGFLHQVNDEAKFIDFENLDSFTNYLTDFIYYLSDNRISVIKKQRLF